MLTFQISCELVYSVALDGQEILNVTISTPSFCGGAT